LGIQIKRVKKMKNDKIDKKEYTSIQLTKQFKEELKKIRDKNHFDSYQNVIKYLITKNKRSK